jgi:glycosyltransferase involved in cell wall biosynthesis
VEPKLSVVIPTRNRAGLLTTTLRPLLEDPAAHEIVVADDGSTDDTPRVLERLAATSDRLRVKRLTGVGAQEAREEAAQAATGDVLLCLDDDVLLAPGTVSGHLRRHLDGRPKLVAGFTPVRLPERRSAGQFPRYLYDRWYRETTDWWECDPEAVLRQFWAMHFSARRDDVLGVRDETAGYGNAYGEDSYFGRCLRRRGVHAEYAPELRGEHLYDRSIGQFRRDARGAGAMQAKLERLAPEMLATVGTYDATRDHPALTRALVRMSEERLLRALVIGAVIAAGAVGARLGRFGVEDRAGTMLSAIENHAGYLEARCR